MSYQQNVTMLADLPDVDEFDQQPTYQGFTNQPGMPEEKLNKFIRKTQQFAPDSGMSSINPASEFVFQNGGYGASRMSNSHHATLGYGNEHLPPPPPSQEMYIPPPPMAPMLNCIDVAGHIKDCPICSKFYKSDSTVYVIAIVLLAIVCLLLLKKVLDV